MVTTPPVHWSPSSQRLWQAVRDCRPLDLAAASDVGTADSSRPTSRQVPAEVIATLLLEPPAPEEGAVSRLRLTGAHITGRLQLPSAVVEIPFSLIDCRFDEPVELADASLRAADFTGCHIPRVSADRLRVDGSLTLAQITSDRVDLFGGQINGDLWLTGARIDGRGPGFALNGPQLRVEGGFYAHSAHVTGGMNLWGAQAFTLEMTHARLNGDEERPAFRGDGLNLTQDLKCASLLIEDGGIRLFGAKVGGQCWLAHSDVRNSNGWAVSAPALAVGGGIYAHGLRVEGGINLYGAVVGESIEFTSSTILPYHQCALRGHGIRVGSNITLGDSTGITGNVVLPRAEVKGFISLKGTTFSAGTAIDLNRATIGTLHLESIGVPAAKLDLSAAIVSGITDAADSWPTQVSLTDLTYRALQPMMPASQRLTWLRRGTGYHPQPYEQLATYYRQLGHEDDARTVLLARHRQRRRGLPRLAKLWSYIEDAAVGYGYRPGRALAWLLALVTAAAITFCVQPPRPAESDGPAFEPAVFALDLIMPILDLGQEKAFTPVGWTAWIAWVGSLTGWLLGTTVISSVTRRLTR